MINIIAIHKTTHARKNSLVFCPFFVVLGIKHKVLNVQDKCSNHWAPFTSCMAVCMCIAVDIKCLLRPSVPLYFSFLRQGLSLDHCFSWAGWAASFRGLPAFWGSVTMCYHAWLWCGYWGSELRCSCLHGKHFVHWAILSPYRAMSIVVTLMEKTFRSTQTQAESKAWDSEESRRLSLGL